VILIECTHLTEDEGSNIGGFPEAGVEEMWQRGHWEGVEDLWTVQDVVHSLVTPPSTGHYKVKVKLNKWAKSYSESVNINRYLQNLCSLTKKKFKKMGIYTVLLV
jgi:hypothetical protein